MAEETKVDNMPAGAGTQEAPKPEAKQETKTEAKQETKAEPTLREKMFGGKINKKEEKPNEDSSKPDAESNSEPKKDKAEEEKPNADGQPAKKGAKERIQELAREKNAYKSDAELKAKEIERLQAELARIKGMSDENKSDKDKYKEVYIEEKLTEHQNQVRAELQDYASKHENPEMFVANYDYYMPLLSKHDSWTISQIAKYPEKIAMFDKMFEAMTNGAFSIQEWVNAPQPLKMQKIMMLNKLVKGELDHKKPEGDAPAEETKKPEETKKEIPDSVVPDKQPGYNPENKESKKGETFRKVFEKGRTK